MGGKTERVPHGKRHYDLCIAVDGTRLSIALEAILEAGADPEMVRMGKEMVEAGRNLIILANDRVGDTARVCVGTLGQSYCGLRHNHEGPCREL